MFNKQDYIAEMRAKESQALKDGYSKEEIREAYKVAKTMKVNYLSFYTLKRGREELQKNGK